MEDNLEDPIKADFRNFLFLVWRHLALPTPTEFQYDIALYLATGPRRRIVEAFRGIGKSWVTAAYVLWRLYCNYEERILVVSASKDRADSFSIFVKRLIAEMPILAHLAPREGQRDSNIAFDVGPSSPHQAPSVKSVGITGQLAGSRATIIIADDVEIPKNSLTQPMRDKLAEAVKEFDAVLVPGGEIIYLGTPQTEMSIYNLLPDRGYEIRIWPARYPTAEQLKRYGDRLAPIITDKLEKNPELAGKPVEPSRFNETDLLERALSYGRSGFALQFMLDTSASDADRYPLRLSDLVVMDLDKSMAPVRIVWASGPQQRINEVPCVGLQGDSLFMPMWLSPDMSPYQGIILAIDPSGRGGDELGYCILAMLNGYLFLLDAGGLTGGYSDHNMQYLAERAREFKVSRILIESNFGDGMFGKLLQPFLTRTWPCTIDEVRHNTQKEARIIDTLEPVMNQHRLIVDKGLVRRDQQNPNGYAQEHAHRYQLFYQMTRITKERKALAHDDRIDVVAMAVAYWVEMMSKDVEMNLREHRDRLLDDELAKFATQVLGAAPSGPSWNPITGN